MRAILDAACRPNAARGAGRALGVAGTATSLAAIAQKLDPYDPEKVHGYRLEHRGSGAIFKRLAAMPLEQRRQVTGLHPDRASRSSPAS